jgi:hypothetical protein
MKCSEYTDALYALDRSARIEAEGFGGRVWNAQHRFLGVERQMKIEQGAHPAFEPAVSHLAGSVFLGGSISR